jgi:hypothetical protein
VTAQAVNAIQRMMELSFRRRLSDARLRFRHVASDDLKRARDPRESNRAQSAPIHNRGKARDRVG